MTNNHLQLIQESLLEYFFHINALYRQKRVMRRAIRKPWIMTFKHFVARLTEINNFLLLFPVSDVSNKMEMEEINDILFHAVSNRWAKQAYLQGWYFEMKTYRETCAMFDRMEVTEQVYEGGTPSKMPTRSESNRDVHVRKWKGGEAASPTNPKKGHANKGKTKNSVHPSNAPTGEKKTCLLHGPGHS